MSTWMVWVYLFVAACTAIASYEREKDFGMSATIANIVVGLLWPLVIGGTVIQRILRGK